MPFNPLSSDLITLSWTGFLQASANFGFDHLIPPFGAPAVTTSNTVSTNTAPSGILVTGTTLDGFFPQPLAGLSGNGLIKTVGAGVIPPGAAPPSMGRAVTLWDVVYHYGRLTSVAGTVTGQPSWASRLAGAPHGSVKVLGYYSASARQSTAFNYQRTSTGGTNYTSILGADLPAGTTTASGTQFLSVPVRNFYNASTSVGVESDISSIQNPICPTPEGTLSFLLVARVLGVFPIASYRRMPAGIVITPDTCLGVSVTAHTSLSSAQVKVDLEIET